MNKKDRELIEKLSKNNPTIVQDCNITVQPKNYEALNELAKALTEQSKANKANSYAVLELAKYLVNDNSNVYGIYVGGNN